MTHGRRPDAVSLGAALYIPSIRPDLARLVNGDGLPPGLRAAIFCTEDAVRPEFTDLGVQRIADVLPLAEPGRLRRFVRARNPAVLARLVALPHIDRIDGFVLPKIDDASLPQWLPVLADAPGVFMPTLETPAAFEQARMVALRDGILGSPVADRLLCMRIGGNDLLGCLGVRRPRPRVGIGGDSEATAYAGPLGMVIAQLAGLFLPYGIGLSGPVFEGLANTAGLQAEVALDLAHGLTGKTAVHPRQVEAIHACYRVDPEDLEEAALILAPEAPAVFQNRATMCEPTTHAAWARSIQARAAAFGTTEEAQLVTAM